MSIWIATRKLEEIDAGLALTGDRIVHLPEAGDLENVEPGDQQSVGSLVEVSWTDVSISREAAHAGPAATILQSEAGIAIVIGHPQIGLTWPGCNLGTLQVFVHPDWPGSYRSVNVSPRFWTKDLLSFEDIALRGELLPDDSRPIFGVPRSGLETFCQRCHARTDLRFPFGHAWRKADHIFRVGTSEIIAHAEGDGMTSDDGCYCADCIDAGFQIELTVPDGRIYDRYLNRSLTPGDEGLLRARALRGADDPEASGIERYGRDVFEWRLDLDPAACRERLARARATFASWSDSRSQRDEGGAS